MTLYSLNLWSIKEKETAGYSTAQQMITHVEMKCEEVYKLVMGVFENPEQPLMKFIQELFTTVIKVCVSLKLICVTFL